MKYDREAALRRTKELDEIRRIENRKNDITAAVLTVPALVLVVLYFYGVNWVLEFMRGLADREPFNWAAIGTFFVGLWIFVRILLRLSFVWTAMRTTWRKIKAATPEFDEEPSDSEG